MKSKSKSTSMDDQQKQSAEWDSNDCGFCILCNTPFSIFRNRKHHCRKCGRLVCESCSSRRMKLDSNVAISPHSKQTDQPQRVCDPCFLMLTKKEEQKIEFVVQRDKHMELLMTTSMISESLIDVYFLDGSYKTVCYDDATTIAELANNICFSVKIALFEVLQDINDPRQFQLLKPCQTVVDLVTKWKNSKLKYCKIVLPLYDLLSAYPNFTSDNYKSALKRIFPSAPLDHSGPVHEGSRTASTSILTSAEDTNSVSVLGGDNRSVIDVRAENVALLEAAALHHHPDSRFDDHSSRSNSNAIEIEDSNEPIRTSFTNAAGARISEYLTPTRANLDSPSRLHRDVSSGMGSVMGSLELASKETEIKKLKMELDATKEKLLKSSRQCDMFKSLCLKHSGGHLNSSSSGPWLAPSASVDHYAMDHHRFSNNLGSFSELNGLAAPSRDSVAIPYTPIEGGVLKASAPPPPSILFKDQVSKESLEKRNSFTWASLGFTSSKSSSSTQRGSISGHPSSHNVGNVTGGNSLMVSPQVTIKKSSSVATFNAHNNNINSQSAGRHSFYGNKQSISSRYLSSESAVGLDFNLELSSTSTDNLQQKVNEQQDELMACPLKILDMDSASFTLFVRTYYHKISELELFCNKFDKVFSTLLTHEYIASAPSSDLQQEEDERAAATELMTSVNTAVNSGHGPTIPPPVVESADSQSSPKIKGKLTSNSIVHLYHMIVAIDGVYEFLMTDFEVWRSSMKSWLLRIFAEAIKLPVLQPDDLRAVVLCLQKDQLMFENEVIDIIGTTIDTSLSHNINPGNTSTNSNAPQSRESLLGGPVLPFTKNMEETFHRTNSRSAIVNSTAGSLFNKYNFVRLSQYMDNIINTFNHIVGDLIHIIPDEVQTMTIFMSKAQRIIKEELKLSYYTHKSVMLNSELMTIYKFLDTLIKLFAQFGIEKDIVNNLTEFMNDVFKQAHSSTIAFMSASIGKFVAGEEKFLQSFVQRQSFDDLEDYSASAVSTVAYNMYDRVFTSSWPDELNALLKNQLGLIPPAVAPTIKVYLSTQLLDCLSEFNDKQVVWIKQLPLKLNSPTIDKLCLYINNQYYFISLMTDTIEAWAYSIDDHHMAKISEKLDAVSKAFKESAISAGEALTKILHADLKDILRNDKHGLFTKSWENSIKSLTLVKGCLKKNLSGVCYNVNNDIDGCAEMRQSIVYEACCSVVSIYIESLLCSSTFSLSTQNNVTNIGSTTGTSHTQERLMEDVEVLTKLFEELRANKTVNADDERPIVYTTSTVDQNTAANGATRQYTRKRTLGATIVGSLFRRGNSSGGMQRSNSSADLKASASSDNLSSLTSNNSSANLNASNSSAPSNKQKFAEILKPLSHIVFAGQMEGHDLVDFVKQELYPAFGVVCVRLWQLLMHWKGENKETIEALFAESFENWTPRRLQNDLLMSLPYLNNNTIKHVNFLK